MNIPNRNVVSDEIEKALIAANIETQKIKEVKRVEVSKSPIKGMFAELMEKRADTLFFITEVKTNSGEVLNNVLIQEGGDWDYSITSGNTILFIGKSVDLSTSNSPLICGFSIKIQGQGEIFFTIPESSEVLRIELSKSVVKRRA